MMEIMAQYQWLQDTETNWQAFVLYSSDYPLDVNVDLLIPFINQLKYNNFSSNNIFNENDGINNDKKVEGEKFKNSPASMNTILKNSFVKENDLPWKGEEEPSDDSRFPSARDVKDRPDYDEGCEFIQDSLKTPIPIGKP
ncbi:15846_t:CDS:2 [Entrophospora sp. SA101]|nr:15846_t:CDS:2 [Entrophospora sp. SA101]